MSKRKLTIFIATLFAGLFLRCKIATKPETIDLPEKNLSYQLHIRPIFLNHCTNNSGCHQSNEPAAELDLQTPQPSFISRSGLVVIPQDPEHSLLYQLLLESVGNIPRMPYQRNPLPDKEIQAIHTWIKEGAKVDN